ncbi:uncharacterized protein LOC109709077 [Ananas comosus]|uniref:Uncharacterized protein LOC109709077 n=1 Tax=Ananas comosus TaxID=4615 RepID=A0A6P5EZV4_ANACO|nr:uncharacterized protein LOC109709077 [Ananas comosus]
MTPQQESAQEKLERSNRLSLILRKSRVLKSIRGSIPECDKAKDYLKAIEEQFVSFDKALANTLMKRLSGIKYNRAKGVREHIMEMRNIAAQLKALNLSEEMRIMLPHCILELLSSFPVIVVTPTNFNIRNLTDMLGIMNVHAAIRYMEHVVYSRKPRW